MVPLDTAARSYTPLYNTHAQKWRCMKKRTGACSKARIYLLKPAVCVHAHATPMNWQYRPSCSTALKPRAGSLRFPRQGGRPLGGRSGISLGGGWVVAPSHGAVSGGCLGDLVGRPHRVTFPVRKRQQADVDRAVLVQLAPPRTAEMPEGRRLLPAVD